MAALLGPPELYSPRSESKSLGQDSTVSVVDPFMNLMVANFNHAHTADQPLPPRGYTENFSGTYLSTGNPCLDLFFHVVPDTPSQSLTQRLRAAWDHDPLTTLKLICNLRGVRGTGKSDKESAYTAALWLHGSHPKTLALNIASFAEFGYFKDLPEILYRLLEGQDVRRNQKAEWQTRKSQPGARRRSKRRRHPILFHSGRGLRHRRDRRRRVSSNTSREFRIQNAMAKSKAEKEKASLSRKEKKIDMAKKAVQRYSRDPDFRFLYERVSDLFAECLKVDVEHLSAGTLNKISLASKWCPSLDSSFDRATLLCESIARKVFPREAYPEYQGIQDAHYAYRIRDRLRKQVLVPLRKALELPEVFIGANRWNAIPYNRVPSVAMKLYKEKFLKHDRDRFNNYLGDVAIGKSKIAAGALLPHEIIASLNDDDGGQVAELQWKRMVDNLLKKGKLANCLAVCDVSGSMSGTPMEVCVALGLLVSELSEEPWKGKVLTFSRNPKLHLICGNDLRSKTEFITQMEWGMNTNFKKVFDRILEVAVNGKLKEEQMIRRIFVFSDMEFDKASTSKCWETDYQVITKMYEEKGYGNAVPEIVFWNLRDSAATPVPSKQKGVALVSGFSKNLMKIFLESGEISPVSVMEIAISGQEYQKLIVMD